MNNTFFKRAGLVIALIQSIEALALHKHDADAAVENNLAQHIEDSNSVYHVINDKYFGGPGMVGDPCFGFDETTGQEFGACAKGLMCKKQAHGEVSIPGRGNICVQPLAQKGDKCKGFNEATGESYPDCDGGLKCIDTGLASIGGGSSNICVAESQIDEQCEGSNPNTGEFFGACAKGLQCMKTSHVKMMNVKKICVVPAQIDEPCQGYDESRGMPFPDCAAGLTCKESGKIGLHGQEKVCAKQQEDTTIEGSYIVWLEDDCKYPLEFVMDRLLAISPKAEITYVYQAVFKGFNIKNVPAKHMEIFLENHRGVTAEQDQMAFLDDDLELLDDGLELW